jgi:predicted ferric reductase
MLALLWPIRRKAFELFYRFHWAGFLLLLAAALAHGAYYIVAGAGLWFLDVLFRYFYCRNSLKERNTVVLLPFRLRYGYQASCKHSRKATIEVLPADVVRVTIPTLGNFTYRPGQYIFLCVPEIGLFEWHPFSISSAPCESAKVRKEIHTSSIFLLKPQSVIVLCGCGEPIRKSSPTVISLIFTNETSHAHENVFIL